MERRATPAPALTATASYCGSEAKPSASSGDPAWVTLPVGQWVARDRVNAVTLGAALWGRQTDC
jgi:hypothetical protein